MSPCQTRQPSPLDCSQYKATSCILLPRFFKEGFTDICLMNSQDMELIDMNLPLVMINYISSELPFVLCPHLKPITNDRSSRLFCLSQGNHPNCILPIPSYNGAIRRRAPVLAAIILPANLQTDSPPRNRSQSPTIHTLHRVRGRRIYHSCLWLAVSIPGAQLQVHRPIATASLSTALHSELARFRARHARHSHRGCIGSCCSDMEGQVQRRERGCLARHGHDIQLCSHEDDQDMDDHGV
jgi:hypothetical protein